MRFVTFLAFLIAACSAGAVSIDAIYFGQTHLLKPDNPYFGTVGGRDVFIKVHVTDPAAVAAMTDPSSYLGSAHAFTDRVVARAGAVLAVK